MDMLLSLLLVIFACGLLAFLIGRAPVIPEDFKQIATWLVLVFMVVYVIGMLFGSFPLIHFRGA